MVGGLWRRYAFRRYRPCIVARSSLSPRSSGPSRPSAARRVVWAEDSDSDQYLIKAAIAGTPHESMVHFTGDGHEALKEIGKQRPAGLVLDINMPNLDGLAALQQIRRDHGDLPVIVFSTANDADQVRACRDLGVLAYAVKPVDYDAFSIIVRSILAHFQDVDRAKESFTVRLREP